MTSKQIYAAAACLVALGLLLWGEFGRSEKIHYCFSNTTGLTIELDNDRVSLFEGGEELGGASVKSITPTRGHVVEIEEWLSSKEASREGQPTKFDFHVNGPIVVLQTFDRGTFVKFDLGGAEQRWEQARCEIVSRKLTQFDDIKPETGIAYLRELSQKYPVGATIADVPTTRRMGIAGEQLRGQKILEVPRQNSPISQDILDFAASQNVWIRDIDGLIC